MSSKRKISCAGLLYITSLVSAHALWDQNANGLSDVWESHHSAAGLNLEADDDGDKRSNAQEAIAGTDPLSASPYSPSTRGDAPGTFFTFLQEDNQTGSEQLFWWAVAGKKYVVQSSTDLIEWNDEATMLADTDSEYSYATGLDISKKFWRVQVADFDLDRDSLSAYEEIYFGTSDNTIDSDSDSYPDTFEISYSESHSVDPNDPNSKPPTKYVVALDGSGDFTDLKSAIEAIDEDYQVIVVKPGTYTGVGNTGVSLDETDHKILILGEQGPGSTRIDGAGQHECLYFANASAVVGISVVDCVGGTSLALENNAQTANSLVRDFSSPEPGKAQVAITWNP